MYFIVDKETKDTLLQELLYFQVQYSKIIFLCLNL